jgi:hypothetical protein
MFHVKHRGADSDLAALEKMVSRETSGLFHGAEGLENAILQNNPMH